MSSVSYNSNSIIASNKELFTFGTNVLIHGNVGIGTNRPLYNLHVEDLTFNMSITLPNEGSIYSSTYNQYYGLLPIGSIVMIPTQRMVSLLNSHGWLECDGTTYTQSSYPLLEPLLRSTNYGNGTGFNASFKVPDFRNRIPMGGNGSYSQTYYTTNTSLTTTLTVNHLPPHTHSGTTNNPDNLGYHGHDETPSVSTYNTNVETNNCCGGSATNSSAPGGTTGMLGVSSYSHSHGASWGYYNNTNLQSISIERNKLYVIYMIKAR